jgi:hypothetical protein
MLASWRSLYILMFPEETAKHLAMLKDMDNSTFSSSVRSMRIFLLYGCNAPKVPCDLTCASGRDKYLKTIKPHRISKFRLDSGFFRYRFDVDGQKHCSIPTRTNDMCQLCLHTWMHVFDDLQRKDKQKKRNSHRILRCLVCNVNLCQECEHRTNMVHDHVVSQLCVTSFFLEAQSSYSCHFAHLVHPTYVHTSGTNMNGQKNN